MIVLFIGERGSGKSTGIVSTALDIYPYRQLVSNLTIKLPNIQKFNINMLLDNENVGRDFIIDELSQYIDKRRSMSDMNVLFSHAFYQSRKFQNDFYGAIQDETIIDERDKKEVDLRIYCYNFITYYYYKMVNKFNQNTGNFIIPIEKVRLIQQYFDTFEIIKSDKEEELLMKFSSSDKIDNIIEENMNKLFKMLSEYNQKLSEKFIGFYLDKKHLPNNKKLRENFYMEAKKKQNEFEKL